MFRLNCRDRDNDSLFSIVKAVDPGGAYSYISREMRDYITNAGRNGHVTTRGESRYTSMLEMFDRIIYNNDLTYEHSLDDEAIIQGIYHTRGPHAARITGSPTAAHFLTRYNQAVDNAGPFFQVGLATLANTSFGATYDNKDVAALLARTGAALNTEIANRRVFETGYILNRIINKGRGIAAAIMLNEMHVERFKTYKAADNRPYYNQGSVLYTYLTFAYLIARDNGTDPSYNEARWYFYWKVLGSLLGLHRYLIPNTHAEAAALWTDFNNDGQLVGASNQRTRLLRAFNLGQSRWELVKFAMYLKSQYFIQRTFWKIPGLNELYKTSKFIE